ncbi:hypothetical protein [Streptomyces rochei]
MPADRERDDRVLGEQAGGPGVVEPLVVERDQIPVQQTGGRRAPDSAADTDAD